MSDMNGNPHYQPAANRRGQIIDAFSEGGSNTVPNTLALAQLEATLALAYEQRTANMQRERDSLLNWVAHPEHGITPAAKTNLATLDKQIEARLGLTEKED